RSAGGDRIHYRSGRTAAAAAHHQGADVGDAQHLGHRRPGPVGQHQTKRQTTLCLPAYRGRQMTDMAGLDHSDVPHIQAVNVACYRMPTDTPEGDGTLRWSETELVVVHIEAGGRVGMGYSYTAAQPAARLILDKLSPAVVGRCVYDIPALWGEMNER